MWDQFLPSLHLEWIATQRTWETALSRHTLPTFPMFLYLKHLGLAQITSLYLGTLICSFHVWHTAHCVDCHVTFWQTNLTICRILPVNHKKWDICFLSMCSNLKIALSKTQADTTSQDKGHPMIRCKLMTTFWTL
jgi:hypothetical protein